MGWRRHCHLSKKLWREASAEGSPQAFSHELTLGKVEPPGSGSYIWDVVP